MKIKTYLRILLVLLITLTASSLKSQEYGKSEWKPLVQGDFSVKYLEPKNNQIILAIQKGNATSPVVIDSKQQISPIIIFNESTGKLVNLKDNWKGDPINIHRTEDLIKVSDNVYIINDWTRVVRAEIVGDSIIYTETFKISGLTDRITWSHLGKNNIYYAKNVIDEGYYLYKCDKFGNLIKKISINKGIYLNIQSIAEFNGELIISYMPDGLNYDGVGVASVNQITGEITRLASSEIENFNGTMIKTIENRLFLTTDSYKYHSGMLFERIDGNWIALTIDGFPREINGKLYLKYWPGDIFLPTNDTMEETKPGFRELPIDLSQGLGEFLDPTNHAFDPFAPDPKTKITFDQDFINAFTAKNGYDPLVNYVFDYVGVDTIVYGIGDGIIAYLGTKTDEVKTSKVDLPRFTIYPNPANDVISVNNLPKEVIYTITNYVGEVLLSNTTVDKIDISNLPTGLYFLNLNGYKSERFTKK